MAIVEEGVGNVLGSNVTDVTANGHNVLQAGSSRDELRQGGKGRREVWEKEARKRWERRGGEGREEMGKEGRGGKGERKAMKRNH